MISTFRKGHTPILIGCVAAILAGCGPKNDLAPIPSADGTLIVVPSIEGGNVKLTLQDDQGNVLDEVQTAAPDTKMWAGGWFDPETFVLANQKTGPQAWNVKPERKFNEIAAAMAHRAFGAARIERIHPID
jgi:hypothetical protein